MHRRFQRLSGPGARRPQICSRLICLSFICLMKTSRAVASQAADASSRSYTDVHTTPVSGRRGRWRATLAASKGGGGAGGSARPSALLLGWLGGPGGLCFFIWGPSENGRTTEGRPWAPGLPRGEQVRVTVPCVPPRQLGVSGRLGPLDSPWPAPLLATPFLNRSQLGQGHT